MRALLLDFNGTLSDDERLLGGIYEELFAEHGRPLAPGEYEARLAGLTDEEMFRELAGDTTPLIEERVARYCARAADGHTIGPEQRRTVEFALATGPVVVVTSAFRREVEAVLSGAGLALPIVAVEDVAQPKPDAEPYLRACTLAGVEPADALAVEDTPTGVAAAHAAGVRCAAVTATVGAERLAAADLLVPALTPELLQREHARALR